MMMTQKLCPTVLRQVSAYLKYNVLMRIRMFECIAFRELGS